MVAGVRRVRIRSYVRAIYIFTSGRIIYLFKPT